MARKDATIYALLWAAAGFALLYVAPIPAPRYNPIDGAWAMSFPDHVPSMGWYGKIMWGTAGGSIAAAIRLALAPWIRTVGVNPLESVAAGVFLVGSAAWAVYAEWQHWIAPG